MKEEETRRKRRGGERYSTGLPEYLGSYARLLRRLATAKLCSSPSFFVFQLPHVFSAHLKRFLDTSPRRLCHVTPWRIPVLWTFEN